jgi:hypothetical protein
MSERRRGKDRSVQKKERYQPEEQRAPQAAENSEKATRTSNHSTAPGVCIVAKRERKSNLLSCACVDLLLRPT